MEIRIGTIGRRGFVSAVLFLCVVAFDKQCLGQQVTPADWPKECRWPDRVLEDGRAVNLRPLFSWYANWLAMQQARGEKAAARNFRPLSEREQKIQQAENKPNPMPLWVLVGGCESHSTSNNVAIVIRPYRGRGRFDQPTFVILNHPDSGKWVHGEAIAPFYALKVGQRKIDWQGENIAVDVYDHGKVDVPQEAGKEKTR